MKIKDLNFVDLENVKVAEDDDNKKKKSMFRYKYIAPKKKLSS